MNNSKERENSWSKKTSYLLNYAAQNGLPVSGTVELSSRCNLSCKFCYIKNDSSEEILSREKTTTEWKQMAKEMANSGTVFLLITGGEPLLRDDFRELYEHFNNIGFNITLFTNGTLINEDFIQWLSPIRPSRVAVTIYGGSPQTYKLTTGSSSAYKKTLEGIDRLLEAGIHTELRCPISKLNKHELKQIEQTGAERGQTIHFFHSLINAQRGKPNSTEFIRLSPDEIKNLALQDSFNLKEENDCDAEYRIPDNTNKSIPSAMKCMAGKSSYVISWDGYMLPCSLMSSPATEPFKSGFKPAWDELIKATHEITGPAICRKCHLKAYCEVCPAKLQAETNSFNRLSSYICESAITKKQILDQTSTTDEKN